MDCGRRVTLEGLYFDYTYSGMLEGRPNDFINNHIIEQTKNKPNIFPGAHQPYLIPPEIDRTDPERPILPPVRMWISLLDHEPIDPKFMGSSLVVICFVHTFTGRPVENVIAEVIRPLDWNSLAHDFDW